VVIYKSSLLRNGADGLAAEAQDDEKLQIEICVFASLEPTGIYDVN